MTFDFDLPSDPCEAMAVSLKLTCSDEGDAQLSGTPTIAAGCYAYRELKISTGANVLLKTAGSHTPSTIIAQRLVIESGATLHSDGEGYAASTVPGSASGVAGGGHGGRGMSWLVAAGGAVNGSTTLPISPGSGGGKRRRRRPHRDLLACQQLLGHDERRRLDLLLALGGPRNGVQGHLVSMTFLR